jgi:hypothetical protein
MNSLQVQAQISPEIIPFFVHILLDNVENFSSLSLLYKIGHQDIGDHLNMRFKALEGFEGKDAMEYKARIPRKNESKWDIQVLILFKKYLKVMKMFPKGSLLALKDYVFPSVLSSLIGWWNTSEYDREFTRDFLSLLVLRAS